MRLNRFLLSGMCALATMVNALGAEPLANAVFSIGTTTTNGQGNNWAYLLWQPTEPNALAGKKIAVYSKAGAANSANNFTPRTITQRQTDPLVIQSLLTRAANLGDDLAQLEVRVNAMFAAAVPRPNLTLPEKISAVIRGSENDPQLLANVIFLGRLHPSLNMCLGHAWAEPVPAGKTTFEIRDFDVTNNKDLGVIGRVTVDTTTPIVLPAPGMPVQYNEPSAMGDLNIKLRWATPDPLREVGLLQHGYNLYRIPKGLAEAANFHITPPTRAALPGLVDSGVVKRINGTPITVNKLHDGLSALNFTTDPTWYVADDNNRYRDGGIAFANGEQFYYFVTARDLLGRDGFLSPGGLAIACDRLPPDAPEGVKVENHYTYNPATQTSNQVLKVTWKQSPNTGDVVTAYYVYRWTNATVASQVGQTNPLLNRIAGPIAHVNGQTHASYIDNGPGSPHAPDDYNKTYWYTVRAADAGVCTNNLSPNSSPAFGVLRDRIAPGEPTGAIDLLCCRPGARTDKDFLTSGQNGETNLAYYRFVVSRTNQGLAYAEFYFTAGGQTNVIGRADFPAGLAPLVYEWNTNRVFAGGGLHRTFARIVAKDDKHTQLIEGSNDQLPQIGTLHVVQFVAYLDCRRVQYRPSPTGQGDCDQHTPNNPDTGEVEGPIITFLPPVTSKEFRLYRRVNFGPMTLIKQGKITNDPPEVITAEDPNPPANAAALCYYVQCLDEHGNAGPMTQIDDCFKFKLPNPKPLLSPLTPEGTESNPQMAITWFCPPWGVERFEVFISPQGITPMPNDIGGGLEKSTDSLQPTNKWVYLNGSQLPSLKKFFVYRTPRVGPQFGQGGFFQTIVNVESNKNYYVFIKPVGLDGEPDPDSSNSKVEKFIWNIPVEKGPQVPWPARALPGMNTNAFPEYVRPIFINNTNVTTNFVGVGIIVGTTARPSRERESLGKPAIIDGQENPMVWLAAGDDGNPIFPCAVYRFQETNSFFPSKVSGDVVQVTPLMERIAYNVANDPQLGAVAQIYDPFIDVLNASLLDVPGIPPGSTSRNALVLLDTQPVILGAKYRYVIVRYGQNGEISEVVPTEPVTIQ